MSGNGSWSEYGLLRWLWKRWWMRLGTAFLTFCEGGWADILLGPEGTNPSPLVSGDFSRAGGGLFWMVICILVTERPLVGVGCGRVGVGGCLLRIAQWMRASLWSSC
jgi:hypothetical protein